MPEPTIRPAAERDVAEVIDLYRAVYGDSFPYREFYDASWIKRGVYDERIVWLVAESDGGLVGSAAVMLEVGDPDDLIGEFGRLVVHPDCRGGGIGSKLLQARVEAVAPRLEFGFVETRTAHPGAQKIATRTGFCVVGFEPLAYEVFGRRESVVLICRHFGHALRLRKNNPLVTSQIHAVGCLALRNCGLDDDLLVEQYAEPYPSPQDETLGELEDQQVYRLLRLSRDRLQRPEVFGSMRLEYGFLKIKAHAGRYLFVKRGETIVGGLGYIYDDIDHKVRIFEMVGVDDRAKGALLELGLERIEAEHDPAYVSIDVSAYEPRLQATLQCLGFTPCGYCPAMVFSGGERLDVVKMIKLRLPVKLAGMELIEPAAEMQRLVEDLLCANARGVQLDDVARRVRIFQGLTDVQIGRVRDACRESPYEAGETVFSRDSVDQALFIVLDGEVEIRLRDEGPPLAVIGEGEIFGELALIDELPRSAGAICARPSRLLVIRQVDFHGLTRRDPELGMVILRNIAQTLSQRLRDTNRRIEETVAQKDTLLGGI